MDVTIKFNSHVWEGHLCLIRRAKAILAAGQSPWVAPRMPPPRLVPPELESKHDAPGAATNAPLPPTIPETAVPGETPDRSVRRLHDRRRARRRGHGQSVPGQKQIHGPAFCGQAARFGEDVYRRGFLGELQRWIDLPARPESNGLPILPDLGRGSGDFRGVRGRRFAGELDTPRAADQPGEHAGCGDPDGLGVAHAARMRGGPPRREARQRADDERWGGEADGLWTGAGSRASAGGAASAGGERSVVVSCGGMTPAYRSPEQSVARTRWIVVRMSGRGV